MASKSVNVFAPASPNKYPYTFTVTSNEAVVEALITSNKTRIDASATLYGKNIRYDGVGGTLAIYWYDNYKHTNGVLIASGNISTPAMATNYTVSGSIEVEHDNEGKLTGYTRLVWTKTSSNSYVPPSINLDTDSTSLTVLPRATKLLDISATINEELTIEWTKASPTFTHKLEYKIGEQSGEIGKGLVDYATWTPPTELYKEYVGEDLKGELILTTYNGGEIIGTPQTSTITIYANAEDAKPMIVSRRAYDTNKTTKALTGNEEILVFFKSKTRLDIVFNTREYATAKKLVVNNVEYEIPEGTLQSDEKTTQYSISLDLGDTKWNNFTIVITDNRTLTTEDLLINEFVNYIPLDASTSVKRTSPTSGKVSLNFKGNYFNQNFGVEDNSLEISYRYKLKEDTMYSEIVTLTENTDYKISGNKYYSGTGDSASDLVLPSTFDYRQIYDLQLFIKDAVTTFPTINITIVKGIPIFWWNKEKVVVNGELYLADTNGENPINIKEKLSNLIDELSTLNEDVEDLSQNTKPSFAQMWTNGSASLSTQVKVNFWTDGTTIQEGDFVCEPANGWIRIPAGSAKKVEIFAHSAGGDYAVIDLRLTNGGSVWQNRTIRQEGGNRYWSGPVANMICEITDPTQDSYLEMYAGGYNSTFLMNSGFGNQATFMGVRKLS